MKDFDSHVEKAIANSSARLFWVPGGGGQVWLVVADAELAYATFFVAGVAVTVICLVCLIPV